MAEEMRHRLAFGQSFLQVMEMSKSKEPNELSPDGPGSKHLTPSVEGGKPAICAYFQWAIHLRIPISRFVSHPLFPAFFPVLQTGSFSAQQLEVSEGQQQG